MPGNIISDLYILQSIAKKPNKILPNPCSMHQRQKYFKNIAWAITTCAFEPFETIQFTIKVKFPFESLLIFEISVY